MYDPPVCAEMNLRCTWIDRGGFKKRIFGRYRHLTIYYHNLDKKSTRPTNHLFYFAFIVRLTPNKNRESDFKFQLAFFVELLGRVRNKSDLLLIDLFQARWTREWCTWPWSAIAKGRSWGLGKMRTSLRSQKVQLYDRGLGSESWLKSRVLTTKDLDSSQATKLGHDTLWGTEWGGGYRSTNHLTIRLTLQRNWNMIPSSIG